MPGDCLVRRRSDDLRRAFIEREAARWGGQSRRTEAATPGQLVSRCWLRSTGPAGSRSAAWFAEGAAGTAGRSRSGRRAARARRRSWPTSSVGGSRRCPAGRGHLSPPGRRPTHSLLAHPAAGGPAVGRRLVEAVLVPSCARPDDGDGRQPGQAAGAGPRPSRHTSPRACPRPPRGRRPRHQVGVGGVGPSWSSGPVEVTAGLNTAPTSAGSAVRSPPITTTDHGRSHRRAPR
jgi:hypothetical protein